MSLPLMISAEAAVKSKKSDYVPIFERSKERSDLKLSGSYGDPNIIKEAVQNLKSKNFYILGVGKSSLHISAPPNVFEEVFGISLTTQSREEADQREKVINTNTGSGFIDTSNGEFKNLLAGVMLEAPGTDYNGPIDTVDKILSSRKKGDIVPWEIPSLLGDKPLEGKQDPKNIGDEWPYNFSGKGVEVHVIDSGFHKEHSFFKSLYGKGKNQSLRYMDKVPSLVNEVNGMKGILGTISSNIELLKDDIRQAFNTQTPLPFDKIKMVINQFQTQVFSEAEVGKAKGNPNFIKELIDSEFLKIDPTKALSERLERLNYLKTLIGWKRGKLTEQLDIPENDGHGTAAIANVLAIAPDSYIISWKRLMADKDINMANITIMPSQISQFDSVVDSILNNKKNNPKVISCSWGVAFEPYPNNSNRPIQQIPRELLQRVGSWRDKIEKATSAGIVTVFAIGNYNLLKSLIALTSDLDVIFVGGAYFKTDSLNSDKEPYFSSFSHGYIFSEEDKVPTICGLCAPQQATDQKKPPIYQQVMDTIPHPTGVGEIWCPLPEKTDGYFKDPGENWHPLHGTSFSAPQVAGVCAQILEVYNQATPKEVKDILTLSATPITKGQSAQGVIASELGVGMVNIAKAIDYASILSLSRGNETDRAKHIKDLINMKKYKKMITAS